MGGWLFLEIIEFGYKLMLGLSDRFISCSHMEWYFFFAIDAIPYLHTFISYVWSLGLTFELIAGTKRGEKSVIEV